MASENSAHLVSDDGINFSGKDRYNNAINATITNKSIIGSIINKGEFSGTCNK